MAQGPRAYLLSIAAVLLLFLTTACGDTNAPKLDDYKRQVAELFAGYNTDVQALAAGLRTQGTREEVFASLLAYATAGSDRTSRFLADWNRLAVPEKAREVHAEGQSIIEGYKQAYDELAAGARAMDESAREGFNAALEQELPARVQEFQENLNALES